jgi:phosphatidylinositol 3,5-bisphosphate 5-phosphatase
VGCNQTDTRFRILKIDRTSLSELNVIEDGAIYSKQEISDILAILEEGNKITGGLNKVADDLYGIIGRLSKVV